ncbi:hypothetical protein PGO24_23970, partial [Klebsiella aerogenes]
RARRPGRHADREPKGASFRLLLLVLAIDVQQLHHRRRRTTGKREMEISSTGRKTTNIKQRAII